MKSVICFALLVLATLAGCGRVGRSTAPEGAGLEGMDKPETMGAQEPPKP
jgi:hypothetical protein